MAYCDGELLAFTASAIDFNADLTPAVIQLAVAAQIPCVYCVYYHTAVATAFGATEAEIEEAVAHGAQTRHWSMILQGTQIDFETFKAEMDAAMKYMSENSGK